MPCVELRRSNYRSWSGASEAREAGRRHCRRQKRKGVERDFENGELEAKDDVYYSKFLLYEIALSRINVTAVSLPALPSATCAKRIIDCVKIVRVKLQDAQVICPGFLHETQMRIHLLLHVFPSHYSRYQGPESCRWTTRYRYKCCGAPSPGSVHPTSCLPEGTEGGMR